jgi:hypothetical protein
MSGTPTKFKKGEELGKDTTPGRAGLNYGVDVYRVVHQFHFIFCFGLHLIENL